MITPCLHFDCDNRNSFGYCKSTCCINMKYNRQKTQETSNCSPRIVTVIKESPPFTDFVKVVRCKDCLFFTTGKSCCRPEGLIKAREDAFCSYGERRERSEYGHFIVNHSINPRHDQGGVQCDGEVSSKSMETRKKYKIMLSEKYVRKSENGKEWFQFPVNISGQLVAIQTIIPLDPYTEPDLEQVRKEAYDKRYETAKHECEDCNANAVKIADDNAHEAYQKGLEDAWDAARKVTQVRKYGGYGDCLGDVFGRTDTSWDVFDYSAPEVIEKIRQYEQEKEEQDGLRQNIQTIVDQCGYSLDEIATVLQKMKES